MKHRLSITLLLLGMFLVTQMIGLVVMHAYAPTTHEQINPDTGEKEIVTERETLPFGMEYEDDQSMTGTFLTIVTSLIFAILIYGFLMRHDLRLIIKIWFMLVVFLAIGITIYPVIAKYTVHPSLIALILVIPLVYFKVLRPNVYVHNITELLIYPGIFVGFLFIVVIVNCPSVEHDRAFGTDVG